MKRMIAALDAGTEYHDGGTKKHFPILVILVWKEQITTLDDIEARIIFPIPGASGFDLAEDAQADAETWLDSPTNRKTMYNKLD